MGRTTRCAVHQSVVRKIFDGGKSTHHHRPSAKIVGGGWRGRGRRGVTGANKRAAAKLAVDRVHHGALVHTVGRRGRAYIHIPKITNH